MPQIIITTKKPVLVPWGRLPAGIPVDVDTALATFLVERGEAQLMETKTDAPTEPPRPRGRPRKDVNSLTQETE